MTFEHSQRTNELAAHLTALMNERVIPNEKRYYDEVHAGKLWPAAVEELKAKARALGLWNLFLPESEHGAGLAKHEGAIALELEAKVNLRRAGSGGTREASFPFVAESYFQTDCRGST